MMNDELHQRISIHPVREEKKEEKKEKQEKKKNPPRLRITGQ